MITEAQNLDIAVLLPCYNEEKAIESVIERFRAVLPQAKIFVFDNNSTDATVAVAKACGALVYSEPAQGKGHVVRRMFSEISADIFVLCDGDGTYEIEKTPVLIHALLENHLDMVVGSRSSINPGARLGHRFGNQAFTRLVTLLFGRGFSDIFSGFRVFSREFVYSFPALSTGFEVETELTVHALQMNLPTMEIPCEYVKRVVGSESKLRTYSDGLRILRYIFLLFKEVKPLLFFSLIGGMVALLATILAIPLVQTFFETGLVPRLPTAVLCASLMLIAFAAFFCGVILHSVSRSRQEMKRLFYLSARHERKIRPGASRHETVIQAKQIALDQMRPQ